MGTHISKVKSVDLDVWTVEQMNASALWIFMDTITQRLFFTVDTEVGQSSRQPLLGGPS